MLGLLMFFQAALSVAVPTQAGADAYLPLRIAENAGYFAQENVQVVLREVRSEADAAEAMAKGQVDLAGTSLDAALRVGHTRGRPPRLLFGLTVSPPVALLVPAGQRERLRAIHDLRGATIGMPSPGSPEHGVLLSVLEVAGLSPRDVVTTSLGERGLASALAAGDVAAGVIGEPWISRLIEEGKAVPLADLRSRDGAARWLGGETVHAAVFVRSQNEVSASDLTSFCRALLRAMVRLASGSPQDLAAALAPASIGSAEDWAARTRALHGVILEDGRVTPDRLDASLTLSRRRAPFPSTVKLPWWTENLLLVGPLEQAGRAAP